MTSTSRRPRRLLFSCSALALAAASLILATSSAAAVPQNTAQPSLTGTVREGSTMTAVEGQWSGSPTTFEYQWQRCRNDGTSCLDIAGATAKTYLLTSADVGHAIRVGVTAVNADGTSGAWSDATTLPVASKDGPTVTSRPTLSGTPVVGSTLRVTTGRWSAIDLTFTRQWQRCAISGVGCRDIAGATGASYGVRSADVGHTLRVLVTAHTAAHDQTTAATVVSDTVTATPPPTQTETTTVTTPAAQAPVVKFLSLHRVGMRIHVRFQTCVDSPGMVKIFARDLKTRALPYLRTFTLRVDNGCGTFARSWKLLPRFRHDGRFRVTLRAKDENGLLSQIKARSILLRLKLK